MNQVPAEPSAPTHSISLICVLANAVHDRCFGVSALADPELALREISDGGGIHEAVHELLRALPPTEERR